MDRESIIVFVQGMVFYHGVVSLASEKLFKIASVVSLVLFFHKVICGMDMHEFIQRLPSQKRNILSGLFILIGILTAIESLVVYMIDRFIPSKILYLLERIGGCFILCSLILLFSSLFVLGSEDMLLCSFVNRGIYAYIRHPYYLGLILLFLGVCGYMGNVCSIVIGFIVIKDKVVEFVSDEEDILTKGNKEYAKYKKKVPSGIPMSNYQSPNITGLSTSQISL